MSVVNQVLEKNIIKILDRLNIAEPKIGLFNRDLVLMYHSVESEESGYHYAVPKESFEEHIELLMGKFELVSLEEMFNVESRSSRVALTFDDAYEDFYTNVYPFLISRDIPATVFVPTLFIEGDQYLSRVEGFGYTKEHLSWDQMKEMNASGLVKFESHSHSHKDSVSHLRVLKEDVDLSIHLLEKNLGRRPRYFSYPHGRYNPETNNIVLSCGFHKLLTSDSAYVKGKGVEGRFDIYKRNERMPYFKLTIAGMIPITGIRRLRRLVGGE